MRSFLLLSICTLVLAYEPTFKTPDILPSEAKGRYIIKLKDRPSVVKASSYIKAQAAQVSQATLASIGSTQGVEASEVNYGISSTYNSTFLNAMAVTLSEEDLGKLKKKHGDSIEYIEPDLNVYPTGTQPQATWGLARVGSWTPTAKDGTYEYPDAAGQGVDVYVLDTGLTPNHPSFEGRAKFVQSFVRGQGGTDVIGHGTHVAGTIGSSKYGVAKKANIFGVKVLGDHQDGTYNSVIEGIQYVTQKARPGKTVINMSLAGAKAKVMEDALAAARKAGVVVVVAAGNQHTDACNYGPGNSPHALTVGATDENDNTATFSNYGKCVDVFAPGVSITSLGTRGNDDTAIMQGTSMASPHVAGIVALYMSMKSYKNADDVVRDVLAWSNRCVKGAAQGSGRGLAYANANLK
jgi:subtilisin family serine protease